LDTETYTLIENHNKHPYPQIIPLPTKCPPFKKDYFRKRPERLNRAALKGNRLNMWNL
jgi:hypothetical protein